MTDVSVRVFHILKQFCSLRIEHFALYVVCVWRNIISVIQCTWAVVGLRELIEVFKIVQRIYQDISKPTGKTIKPCCRRETARCRCKFRSTRSCPFRLIGLLLVAVIDVAAKRIQLNESHVGLTQKKPRISVRGHSRSYILTPIGTS